MKSLQLLCTLACALLPGCYASSVVAVSDRAVAVDRVQLEFTAATAKDVPGVYSSTAIEGEVAASLRLVHYVFTDSGTYCAAALLETEGGLQYQAVNGTWQMQDGKLQLDAAAPAVLTVAPGHLRIETSTALLLLQRVVLQ